ncbi:MAG: choice-of-anchor L domain-containing protein [Prevotellaceae bacterium]|nr:choice-of-anchor L domain-containing protein [Prevotellaceae bacterium]
MRKFRTNILLLLTLVFASSTIYAQNLTGLSQDSILKIRAAAAAKTKPKNGGGGGIGVMSINPGNKPAGSIAVNRDPAYQTMTPEQLIQEIFVRNGACATVFNVNTSIYGWNGTSWGAARGLAYFNRADSNFPIEEGLVMGTGDVRDTEGPNSSNNAMNGGLNNGSDPDLAPLIPSHRIYNHCKIEFDFVPTANVMEFRYIFASEEYPEYVYSSFNDVFGFFVNDVTGGVVLPKTNIAILPVANNPPVSIDNVNDGYQSSYCYTSNGSNPHNSNYFNRNTCNSAGTEMDGYTVVLTATYNVIPCRTYRLKLAVGNAGDTNLGSAVFLQARSFDVGRDLEFFGNAISGNDYIFKNCQNNYFEVTRTINTNQAATIQVTHSNAGGAVNGIHYTDQNGNPVSQNISFAAGEITKTVHLRATNTAVAGSYFTLTMMCPCEGSTVAITKDIYIYDFIESISASPTSACPGQNNGKITVTPTGSSGKYQYRLGSNGPWQTSNVFNGLSAGTYTVYAQDIGTVNCASPLSQTVTVSNIATNANAGPDINNCNNNVFTLAANAPGPNETGKWTRASGGNVNFANDNLYNTTVTLTSGTTATLRWTLSNGACSAFDDVVISNNALPQAPGVTSPVKYCLGATASPLTVQGTGYSLRWYDASDNYIGTSAPVPSTAAVGSTVYKVSRVNNSTGCESAKSSITVNVTAPPTAKISGPSVICKENTQITLTFTLTGQSMWTVNYIERDLETLTEVHKAITPTSATHTVIATPFNTSEYIITGVTDGNGCVNTDRDSIRVQFQPCGFKSPMLLWLKANDGPEIDGAKFEWKDRSMAFNIDQEAQKTAPYNIVWQASAINFNQAVGFNGTAGQYLSGKALNPNGFSVKSTLFTVTDPTPASMTSFPQGIFSANDSITPESGQGIYFIKPSTLPFYTLGSTNQNQIEAYSNQNSANIGYPILLRGIFPDSTTTENTEFWDNGDSLGTKTTFPFKIYPDVTQHFDVGGSVSANVFDGKIAEIIYFHDLLSDTEASKVESYLAIKYGISLKKDYLASDASTAWSYSGNPTYNTHIAGIGRDNGYALDQRVSHNTSPGDMVTVAHNPSTFVTDQSLASSITADKSYMIWSSNNGAKSFGAPKNVSGHYLRVLNRGWRVHKTGTVGKVSIQFDTTGISIPAGWGAKPALVVTQASNFGSGFTFYQAAAGYPHPTFHNVDLPDGYHFTLVLTAGVTANAGPDQSVCSSSASYKFTMAANATGTDQAGKWEVVTEPSPGTVTVTPPELNTAQVSLAIAGEATLRWIVWNTFSLDADTSYVKITRNQLPEVPVDLTMPAVCPQANNDSIEINQSNTNYKYSVYTAASGGTPIASADGTGSTMTIKPGNKITETTCYYIEIKHVLNGCIAPVRWKVCIPVYADITHPDIRIKVCPNPAYTLDLHKYLNAADIMNSTFACANNPSLIGSDGFSIYTGDMTKNTTYTLNYSVTGHCSASNAKIYIKTLDDEQVPPVPKQVKICKDIDLARNVQLQQILGLDVSDGLWDFDPTLLDADLLPQWSGYITTVNDAYLFNAQKAWLDNKGTLTGTDRHFTFKYHIYGSACIPDGFHELTVIVTENP